MQIMVLNIPIRIYGIGAALSAILFTVCMYQKRRQTGLDTVRLALFALPSALVISRVFYCLARFDFVFLENGFVYALCVWEGGLMMWGMLAGGLMGVFAACKRDHISPAVTLDHMAVPTMLSVAVLRLFEFFTTEGRGLLLREGSVLCFFPFSIPDAYGDWQLAVFFWEAAAALLIGVIVYKSRTAMPGDKVLLMVIVFSASQIVFESLRLDASPKWGFINISQLLSAVALVSAGVIRIGRLPGRRRTRARVTAILLCIAAVAVLEWALDKTTLPVPACYLMMCAAMGAAVMTLYPPGRGLKAVSG
jgi:prolipoprotein diacylglyceryltransferase